MLPAHLRTVHANTQCLLSHAHVPPALLEPGWVLVEPHTSSGQGCACAAVPYPVRLLSRAINPLSNKVLEYVNAQNALIVLCDWDGKVAAAACALLSEKGVQNAVLLHGGELKILLKVQVRPA